MLVEMISAVGDATHELAPGLWRRYLRIIIDGMATARDGHRDLGPAALSARPARRRDVRAPSE